MPTAADRRSATAPSRSEYGRAYGRLPLVFEQNQGQFNARTRYVARGLGYSLSLTDRAAVLTLGSVGPTGTLRRTATVSIGLLEARLPGALTAQSKLASRVNYLIGKDRSRWHTDVPTYERVRYRGVWPGIDVTFYGRQGRLEYDFDVAPGADPGKIALPMQGADTVRVEGSGALRIGVVGGSMRWLAPSAYQISRGSRHAVKSAYVVSGGTVRLWVGHYDRSRPLVIDPTLAYSTYLGGSGDETPGAIAVDSSGAAYVTGATNSSDFPTTPGVIQPGHGGTSSANDVFVTKLAPDGRSLIYSTYIGGTGGDGGAGIAVSAAGAAYVSGSTASSDFPTTPGAVQTTLNAANNMFVAELAPDGRSLVYSTYVGGAADVGGGRIAIDRAGSAYVLTTTESVDFPTTLGVFQPALSGGADVAVVKLRPDGTGLAYSTFLGGTNNDYAGSIAVDADGEAYILGNYTISTDFPTTPGAFQTTGSYGADADAFVTKLARDGESVIYSTYLGGPGWDFGNDIAIDSAGAAYIGGRTYSAAFPTSPGAYQTTPGGSRNAFVSKVSPDGSSLAYSTYLGGSADDGVFGIAVDAAGAACVAGATVSADFPTTAGAYQRARNGGVDVFITKLRPDGTSLMYSTYLGGTNGQTGPSIALDARGAAYITGWTISTDFPTTPGAYKTSAGGLRDGFVSKLTFEPGAVTGTASTVSTTSATLNGTVNPTGSATTHRFDYGTSSGYGTQTTSQPTGFDTADHPASVAIAGLEPNTTYHFRIEATNSAGTHYGNDQTFRTLSAKPAATTDAPSSVTETAATLRATINPENQATTYRFEYGANQAYRWRAPMKDAAIGSDYSNHTIAQAISGLSASTIYHFRVVATSASGTTYGADRTFKTLAWPVASVPGRIGTIGAILRLDFACRGTAGQRCGATAFVKAMEKLSADGKRITAVITNPPRRGRTRTVVVANVNLRAQAGQTNAISISLNSTGRMLRARFRNVPATVNVTATIGARTTTIRGARVMFGPDPPKAAISGLSTNGTRLTLRLTCRGIAGQTCAGTAAAITFEKLGADRRTITGLAYGPTGPGKQILIATARYTAKANRTTSLAAKLNAAGSRLLSKFERVPATLTITPTCGGYTLTPITARVTFKR